MKKLIVLTSAILLLAAACNQQAAVGPAPTPTPTAVQPTPAPAPNSANWKTYTSNQYKYQISYPSSATINTPASTPTLVNINLKPTSGSKFTSTDSVSISSYSWKTQGSGKNTLDQQPGQKTISLNGHDFLTKDWIFGTEDRPGQDVWTGSKCYDTIEGDYKYIVCATITVNLDKFSMAEFNKDVSLKTDQAILEQMLSTFKFTK